MKRKSELTIEQVLKNDLTDPLEQSWPELIKHSRMQREKKIMRGLLTGLVAAAIAMGLCHLVAEATQRPVAHWAGGISLVVGFGIRTWVLTQ